MQQVDHTPQVLRLRKQNIRLRHQLNECEKKIVEIQQKLNHSHLQNASQASRMKEQKIMDRICSHIYSSQFGLDVDNKIQLLEQQNNLIKKQLKRIQRINIVMHRKMQVQRNFFENIIQKLKNERKFQDEVKYQEYFQYLNQIQEQIQDLKTQRQYQQRQVRNLQKKINYLSNSRKLRRDEQNKINNWKIKNQEFQLKAKEKGCPINLYKKDFIEQIDQTFMNKQKNQKVQSPYFKDYQSQISKRSKFFQSDSQIVNKRQYLHIQDSKKQNNNYSSSKFQYNFQNTHEKLNDPDTKINSNQEQQLKTSGFFKQPDIQQLQKNQKVEQERKMQIFKNVNIIFRKNIKSRHL